MFISGTGRVESVCHIRLISGRFYAGVARTGLRDGTCGGATGQGMCSGVTRNTADGVTGRSCTFSRYNTAGQFASVNAVSRHSPSSASVPADTLE